MPLELQLTLGSPLVWLGLIRGMDRPKAVPPRGGPRLDQHGMHFRADDWTLSVALFARPRVPSDAQFAPSPHSEAPFEFTSGAGELHFTEDVEEEAAVGRVFVLRDLADRTSILLPATADDATLTWEWFAQDAVVYRLLIWCPGPQD